MASPLEPQALDQLFLKARTHNGFDGRPVDDEMIQRLYDTMKWGPTSSNCLPARFVFVRTPIAKERLAPCMAAGNRDKTMAAPCTVIIAEDEKFYELMPKLYPSSPNARGNFSEHPELAHTTAFRNSSLQGAYLILAARALGLDCGPMSGFDNKKLDELFFSGTNWKSNFVCNIGYGDPTKLYPRGPRLEFQEACHIL